METNAAYALIDTYDIKDCAAILAVFAPDLYDQLRAAALSGACDDALLSLARDLAKQVYNREKILQ